MCPQDLKLTKGQSLKCSIKISSISFDCEWVWPISDHWPMVIHLFASSNTQYPFTVCLFSSSISTHGHWSLVTGPFQWDLNLKPTVRVISLMLTMFLCLMASSHVGHVCVCTILAAKATRSKGQNMKPGSMLPLTMSNIREIKLVDRINCMHIYPSHGYTALVADEICKNYQAILACWSSLGTYRCM